MNRILTVFLAVLLIFTFSACTSSNQPEPPEDELPEGQISEGSSSEPEDDEDKEPQPDESSTSAVPESSSAPVSSAPPVSSAVPQSSAPAVSSAAPATGGTSQSSAAASSPASTSEPASSSQAEPSSAAPTVNAGNGEFLSSTENEILTAVNAEREALGLSRLTYNSALNAAARIRSKELYDNDHWAHTRPDGREWYTVLTVDSPYDYAYCAENLAYYETDDTSDLAARSGNRWFQQWKGSPSHYANICKEEFTECGISVYTIEKDGVTYTHATMLFGTPK